MGPTEYSIIGIGIALLAVLAPLIMFVTAASKNELKADLRLFRAELQSTIQEGDTTIRAEIAQLRTEMRDGDASLRTEMRDGDASLRAAIQDSETSLRAAIGQLRADMQEGDAALRAELKADIASLRLDVQANRAEIITNRRMLGRFALHRHGDDGLPLAPLTDTLDPPEGAGDNLAAEDGD
jgi:hypothetical protein